MYEDPAVRQLLRDRGVTAGASEARLRGVAEAARLYRVEAPTCS